MEGGVPPPPLNTPRMYQVYLKLFIHKYANVDSDQTVKTHNNK